MNQSFCRQNFSSTACNNQNMQQDCLQFDHMFSGLLCAEVYRCKSCTFGLRLGQMTPRGGQCPKDLCCSWSFAFENTLCEVGPCYIVPFQTGFFSMYSTHSEVQSLLNSTTNATSNNPMNLYEPQRKNCICSLQCARRNKILQTPLQIYAYLSPTCLNCFVFGWKLVHVSWTFDLAA